MKEIEEIREILSQFKDMVIYNHPATWQIRIPIIAGQAEAVIKNLEAAIYKHESGRGRP